MLFACFKVMRHSFVYRGVRIDVLLQEKEGGCRWTCKANDATKARWTGIRSVSMGEGLRLACAQARMEIDRRAGVPPCV